MQILPTQHIFLPVEASSYRLSDDTLHGAREGGCHAEAAVIQDVHRNLEAPTNFPEHTLGRHADIIKVHLCCVGRLDSHLLLRRTTKNDKEGLMKNKQL